MIGDPAPSNLQESDKDDRKSPTSAPFPVMQPVNPAAIRPNQLLNPRPIEINKQQNLRQLPQSQQSTHSQHSQHSQQSEQSTQEQTANPVDLMHEFFGISVKLSMHQNLEFIDETSNAYYLNFNISPQLDVILNKVRKNFILKLVKDASGNFGFANKLTPDISKSDPFLPIAVECVNEFFSSDSVDEIYKQTSGEFVTPETVNKAIKYNDVKKYEFDLYKMFNRLLHFINTRIGGLEIMMTEPGVFLINFSAGISLLDQINRPVRTGFNSAVFNFQLMFVAIFIGIVNNLLNSIGLPNFVEIEPHSTRMDAKIKINFSSIIFEKNIPLASRCDVLTNIKALSTPISEKALTYHISAANLDGIFNSSKISNNQESAKKHTLGDPEAEHTKKNSSLFVVDSRGNQVDSRSHNIIKTLMVSCEEFNALTEKLEQTIATFNKLILDNSFTSVLFLNTQSYKISLTDISRLLGTTAIDVFNDPKYSYVLSLFATFYGINASFISNCQMKCFHRFELSSKFEPKIDSNVIYTLGENFTKFNKLFGYMNEKTNSFNITNTIGPLVAFMQNSNKTHIFVKQSNEEYSIEFLCEKFVYMKIAIYMFMHAIVLNMPPVYVEISEFSESEDVQCNPLDATEMHDFTNAENNLDDSDSVNNCADCADCVDTTDTTDTTDCTDCADYIEFTESTNYNAAQFTDGTSAAGPAQRVKSNNAEESNEYISVSVEPVISTELKPTDICSLEPELLTVTLEFIEKLMKMCIAIDAEICNIAISRKIDSIVNESIMNSMSQFAMQEFLPANAASPEEIKSKTENIKEETSKLEKSEDKKLNFKKFVENLAKNIEIIEGCAVYKNHKSSTM